MENKNNSISENADENFNNDLETISLETETGPMEIKKWDTFKWKSHGAVPFRVARIERINKDKVYFYFVTQNSDGTWPIEDRNVPEKKGAENIIQYLSSAEKIN